MIVTHGSPALATDGFNPMTARSFDNERALLDAARLGDREAAEQLLEESYRGVYAALFRLCGGNADLAGDLTQDSFQKAWQSIHRFDGRSKFSTWLYRIAYTTFLNHVRTPPRTVEWDEQMNGARDPRPAVEETLAARQGGDELRVAVLRLPEDLRFTITAHFWAELSINEIAEIENVTSVAIRKRLRKAYLLLESIGKRDPS
ncbi:MAG TPA: RNA polymerase sigma factor [Thermoanaerobaculia bacterium]|nr:RNA polymerase sigma factor [Thermoanaerobaculia bacterium]